MAKSFEPENKLPNIIGQGTKITGDIETNGDIRIDGNIEGNINSKGKVVIGSNGLIKGEVFCSNAEVAGSLNGKITVSELLSLKASSKVNGDIKTGKLNIEPGAIFSGTCNMGNQTTAGGAVQTPPKEVKK
ncbi:polymer-forming cytoskeletal protein [Marinilabilia salmonicolor]|jgi:cytoskeletal protein CcmA (bactofilin family)|uniref:Cytoskeletal protein CcmA (Bactofilin family) n=1 Tax=Marinilabilia salmonicolor TaxID=989 RepID=A0A2T0XR96_9BACT|nr:polymer-forming cytoskeletal protein [Marinilabilia salmonicolor]PRZ01447.1 cytoskeletal protein CcmA (bactofilin family) [Marinilabilia salmonicolor]RCW31981.1 cytoskeletal protein CcmA (bactofilin family) [Marinilabilia salmonicolor]